MPCQVYYTFLERWAKTLKTLKYVAETNWGLFCISIWFSLDHLSRDMAAFPNSPHSSGAYTTTSPLETWRR